MAIKSSNDLQINGLLSENYRYVCSECGSTNIQVQAWVNANTNEYVSDLHDSGECWCEDCMKHTKLKEV